MKVRRLAALPILLAAALSSPGPAQARAPQPTLGRVTFRGQEGFGRAHPARIFGGGDPTSLLTGIHWSGWGSGEAIGHGTGDFVWPGLSVAAGSTDAPATIVAYGLGRCHGRPAYRKLTWYFPTYGGTFDAKEYEGTCGNSAPFSYTPPPKCPDASFISPPGTAEEVTAQGIDCTEADALLAGIPAVRYIAHGGRFEYAGLYCGSGGTAVENPPAMFECARGAERITFNATG